jgi:hypothetical protein
LRLSLDRDEGTTGKPDVPTVDIDRLLEDIRPKRK